MMTPKEFFEFAKNNGAEMLDLKKTWVLPTPASSGRNRNFSSLTKSAMSRISTPVTAKLSPSKGPGTPLASKNPTWDTSGVFDEELIQSWINWKRDEEIDPLALRLHPYEFHLYYDC